MIKRNILWPLVIFVVFVFLQSLFFKFSNAPETQLIFEGKLEPWAASLGFVGLFAKGGLLSAKVIGSVELFASVLLLIGLLLRKPVVLILGAVLSFIIISCALLFHLFTPLGVVIRQAGGENDGGELFMLACAVWLATTLILYIQSKSMNSKAP